MPRRRDAERWLIIQTRHDHERHDDRTFTIENTGTSALNLPGAPERLGSECFRLSVTAQHLASRRANGPPRYDPILPAPRSATATVSMQRRWDENPYDFADSGYAQPDRHFAIQRCTFFNENGTNAAITVTRSGGSFGAVGARLTRATAQQRAPTNYGLQNSLVRGR